jgi:hypothetical protein
MLSIVTSLTDDPRGIIYNRNIFIIQTTGKLMFLIMLNIIFNVCALYIKQTKIGHIVIIINGLASQPFILFLTYEWAHQARVFVPGKSFPAYYNVKL